MRRPKYRRPNAKRRAKTHPGRVVTVPADYGTMLIGRRLPTELVIQHHQITPCKTSNKLMRACDIKDAEEMNASRTKCYGKFVEHEETPFNERDYLDTKHVFDMLTPFERDVILCTLMRCGGSQVELGRLLGKTQPHVYYKSVFALRFLAKRLYVQSQLSEWLAFLQDPKRSGTFRECVIRAMTSTLYCRNYHDAARRFVFHGRRPNVTVTHLVLSGLTRLEMLGETKLLALFSFVMGKFRRDRRKPWIPVDVAAYVIKDTKVYRRDGHVVRD